MTKNQLRQKVKACLKNDKDRIAQYIEKSINCGAIDFDYYENDYQLAKVVLCAIYHEMSRQYFPLYDSDGHKKDEIENLKLFL